MTARKLTKKTCEVFGYGIGEYGGQPCQVAPYKRGGVVVAQKIRLKDKTFRMVGEERSSPPLFGQHLWEGGKRTKTIVVTEGEIDALSVYQATSGKLAVVSVPNGAAGAKAAVQRELPFFEQFERVVIAFDNDQPGVQAARETAELFPPGKAYLFNYLGDFSDPNEALQKALGAYIRKGIEQAEQFRPDGIIGGDKIWERLQEPVPVGYSLHYPILNAMLQGIRKKELWMITAGSGTGKSTFVAEIGYRLLMKHGLKIGVFALEESTQRIAQRYIGIHVNKPLHLPSHHDALTPEQLREAHEAVTGNGQFWVDEHWGSQDVDRIFAKLRYMAKGLGVDFILFDHVSILISGLDIQDERKALDVVTTNLRKLAESTGVGIVCVTHLNRPKDGKDYSEGRPVSLGALRGSGALGHLSDVVVSIERNQQDETKGNNALIRVLKNRPASRLGPADRILYNYDTGRLLPLDDHQLREEVAQGGGDPF